MNKQRIVIALLLLLTGFTAAFVAVFIFAPPQTGQPPASGAPGGTLVTSKRKMPDFTLTDQDGRPFKLSNLQGKAVLTFYGYTNCPDICPLTLVEMKKAKALLGDAASDTAFVFISVDGERDTPEILKRYMAAFDSAFIGLTGTPDQVRAIAFEYGAAFEKQRPPGTQAEYIMAHTSYTYLLDRQGRWRMVFPYGASPEAIARGTLDILREQ